jgi:hypothetical protein
MPMTLTRSLLTVLIPGLVAVAPWLLMLVQHTSATLGFTQYSTLGSALVFASAVVVGMAIEGLGSYVEVKWDKDRETQYAVDENWYEYLARSVNPEPVGYRYLSRLVTTFYFELWLAFAAPSFFIGSGILAALRFGHISCVLSVAGVVLAGLSAWYFLWQAKTTHEVICRTRKELNERLAR